MRSRLAPLCFFFLSPSAVRSLGAIEKKEEPYLIGVRDKTEKEIRFFGFPARFHVAVVLSCFVHLTPQR